MRQRWCLPRRLVKRDSPAQTGRPSGPCSRLADVVAPFDRVGPILHIPRSKFTCLEAAETRVVSKSQHRRVSDPSGNLSPINGTARIQIAATRWTAQGSRPEAQGSPRARLAQGAAAVRRWRPYSSPCAWRLTSGTCAAAGAFASSRRRSPARAREVRASGHRILGPRQPPASACRGGFGRVTRSRHAGPGGAHRKSAEPRDGAPGARVR